jgi:hypothetical protein
MLMSCQQRETSQAADRGQLSCSTREDDGGGQEGGSHPCLSPLSQKGSTQVLLWAGTLGVTKGKDAASVSLQSTQQLVLRDSSQSAHQDWRLETSTSSTSCPAPGDPPSIIS